MEEARRESALRKLAARTGESAGGTGAVSSELDRSGKRKRLEGSDEDVGSRRKRSSRGEHGKRKEQHRKEKKRKKDMDDKDHEKKEDDRVEVNYEFPDGAVQVLNLKIGMVHLSNGSGVACNAWLPGTPEAPSKNAE